MPHAKSQGAKYHSRRAGLPQMSDYTNRFKNEAGNLNFFSRIEGLRDLETKDAIFGVESRLDISTLIDGLF